ESEVVTGSSSIDFPPALHDDHDDVCVDINLNEETNTSTLPDDGGGHYLMMEYNNIANLVKTKNLESLHQFGGVQGIAEALNTNLEAGDPSGEEDLRSHSSYNIATMSPSYFLLIAPVLSTGFGMREEGPRTGCYEEFFIMVVIIVLVLAPTLRDFWLLKRPQIFKRKPVPLEQEYIEVVRGNRSQEVSISSVVVGDIVVLKTRCLVPADGLFIRGELLVVHDDLASTADEEAPFLFQGSTVTNGMGRMLVTSVGKDTAHLAS
ncbi:P-type ATPase, A domain containing protein, partial [Parasponia andersonii]